MMNIGPKLEEIASKETDIAYEKEALLRACGWSHSSSYPGSFWLWSKSFPESKTQWRWRGDKKEPHPPFDINGTTTEIALIIERSWQELWNDNRTPEDESEGEPS